MDFQTLHRRVKRNEIEFFKSTPNLENVLSLQSKHQESLLHIACRYDRQEILEHFVTALGGDIEVSNDEGKKPLHEAAQFSSIKCLGYLLRRGAHVDSLKRADWTPLMLACTKSCVDIVQTLIDYGAHPCLKNKDGWNSFHIACREGHLPMLETLIRKFPSVWNTQGNSFRTPLHTAALHGHFDVVSWLLKISDSNVDAMDSCGVTPLMDALRSGHVQIASLLVSEYKADASLQDQLGRQAIHHVAGAGQTQALEFLLAHGKIPVNASSLATQETALHTAAKEGQEPVLKILLAHGIDINLKDSRGRTALHIGAGAQSADCVCCLLQHGALVVPDNSGKLPRDFAIRQDVCDAFDSAVK